MILSLNSPRDSDRITCRKRKREQKAKGGRDRDVSSSAFFLSPLPDKAETTHS